MRYLSLLAAFLIAATPIAARADFWLNYRGAHGWNRTDGYEYIKAHGQCTRYYPRKFHTGCTGAGSFDITGSAAKGWCTLSVWKSGTVGGVTWHANLSKNPGNICSINWDNGNTVTLIIQP
jgi:hypothetical protein